MSGRRVRYSPSVASPERQRRSHSRPGSAREAPVIRPSTLISEQDAVDMIALLERTMRGRLRADLRAEVIELLVGQRRPVGYKSGRAMMTRAYEIVETILHQDLPVLNPEDPSPAAQVIAGTLLQG